VKKNAETDWRYYAAERSIIAANLPPTCETGEAQLNATLGSTDPMI